MSQTFTVFIKFFIINPNKSLVLTQKRKSWWRTEKNIYASLQKQTCFPKGIIPMESKTDMFNKKKKKTDVFTKKKKRNVNSISNHNI